MKNFLFAIIFIAFATAMPRVRRTAYEFADGIDFILGNYQTTFSCEGLRYGYYADVDNQCQIFHICLPVEHADGKAETFHWSFFCGNQTVFNQLTLTCAHPEEAVPCENAREFFYVNDNFGIVDAPFLRDEDLERANQYISAAYGDRKGKKIIIN